MKNSKNMFKKYVKFFIVIICLIISVLFATGISVSAAKVGNYYDDWRFDIYTRRNITIRKQTYNYEFL